MFKKIFLSALAGLILSPLAFAEDMPTTQELEQKDQLQKARIEQGANTGHLTDKEKAELEKKQAGIDEEKAQAQGDGSNKELSKGEKKKIERMQERQDARIEKAAHDDDTK